MLGINNCEINYTANQKITKNCKKSRPKISEKINFTKWPVNTYTNNEFRKIDKFYLTSFCPQFKKKSYLALGPKEQLC